jgi:hypothetical protein
MNKKIVSGTPPCKRYGHSATRWKDTIVVFGKKKKKNSKYEKINPVKN